MKLSQLKANQSATIVYVEGTSSFVHRLSEMGFVHGQVVERVKSAPLQDPIEYHIMGYEVSLRLAEAQLIEVKMAESKPATNPNLTVAKSSSVTKPHNAISRPSVNANEIMVALVGNPNSGKTTLFNKISGLDEHTGNYSGVTVESKQAKVQFRGYDITIVDLPGTYSIADFSPEERVVAHFIQEHKPNVIVNVVDSTNLERNLYLTTQLIDMGERVVLSLNMWDEFLHSGDSLDRKMLANLLGMPIVPTVGRRARGIAHLLEHIVEVANTPQSTEPKRINYDPEIEEYISKTHSATRYEALDMLTKDVAASKKLKATYQGDTQTLIAQSRYGFIAGALKESYIPSNKQARTISSKIDAVLTNRFLSLPLFFGILWLTFYATFTLGQYPMEWIESGVSWLRALVDTNMPAGALKDLITGGIIDGIGSVIVFLPNILILFLFISIMEDTGYMARAAFITDKLMHKIGLHGKSFIPLVMGFGCNVPAIMATRTIENRGNRLQTMLITPFMSCSARLPVYILIVSAFFIDNQANILFGIYFVGILLAILSSLLFKKLFFRGAESHFVMELPPYRIPTLRSTVKHMWNKGSQYLRKMSGVILIAVVIIWALGYFPHRGVHGKGSYLETIGHLIEPVLRPLGMDWQMGVSLMSGVAAKEVVVSSMSVIYQSEGGPSDEETLGQRLKAHKNAQGELSWNSAVAFSFLAFVLIYFPCVAAISAIRRESGAWKWAFFTIFYTTSLAWLVSFIVYRLALLL